MVLGLYRLYQIIGAILVLTSVLIAYGIIPNPIPTTPFVPSGIVAITHVNVIPMDEERVLPDQTVIVRDGRIAVIRNSDEIGVPNRSQVIDGTGKYLIPGLIDAHTYLQSQAMIDNFGLELGHLIVDYEQCLLPYVIYGVTSIRVMSAVPEHVDIAHRLSIGNMLGPRMIASMGVATDSRSYEAPYDSLINNAREARQAARLASEGGFDLINFSGPISGEALDALTDEARKLKLPVEGNVLLSGLAEQDALNLPISGIYGIYGLSEPLGEVSREVIQQLLTNDVHVTSVMWIFSNLVQGSELSNADREALEDKYTCPLFTEYIWDFVEGGTRDVTPEILQQRVDFRNWLRSLTAQFHAAGVPIIAGSFSSLARAVPGYSLHSELQELYDSGLTPYNALRTATSTPAAVIDQFSDAGVIAVGKRADLVLLNANPLEDISNTRDIAGVVLNGTYWSADALDQRLEAVKQERQE